MMEPKLTKTLRSWKHIYLRSRWETKTGRHQLLKRKAIPRSHIWYYGRCVKISARRAKKIDRYICYNCKDTVYKENEGILAPKPLGRRIWRDFYAPFPGDLVGFCLIVKTNPRGCPGGQPPGKPMISALMLRFKWKLTSFIKSTLSSFNSVSSNLLALELFNFIVL